MNISFLNKIILTIIIIPIFSIKLSAQKFKLTSIYTDKYYYNATLKDNTILLGTSDGVFKYQQNSEMVLLDKDLKNGIVYDNNVIKSYNPKGSSEYNYLLPEELISKNVVTFKNNNLLFLFTKGKMLVYSLFYFQFENIGSTRSFSDNYIGTYDGVYYKNKKIKQPSYTSGYIKEYETETFICYDGVYRISKKDSLTTNFLSYNSLSTLIFGKELGRTENILKIKKNVFLLTSSIGLYLIDFNIKKSKLLLKNQGSNYRFLSYDTNGINGRVSFFDDTKEYTYNTDTQAIKQFTVYEEPVVDIYSISDSQKFLLTNHTLSFKNSYDDRKNYILLENLDQPHNVGLFKNIIYVTTNNGLNCYDLSLGKAYYNVIIDEFNSRAHYVKNDTLMLGSINGYYKFSIDDLRMQLKTLPIFKKSETKLKYNYSIIFVVIFTLVLVVFNYIFIKIFKKRSSQNNFNQVPVPTLKKEIEIFIIENINIISIDLICDEFNLSSIKLYQIMKPHKPGNFIRIKRMQLVKRMRNKGLSEYLISKKTGFSISYLKKI